MKTINSLVISSVCIFICILEVLCPTFAYQDDFQGYEPLILQISTDKMSYEVGEPILISLFLYNPTNEVVTLTFSTSKIFDGSVWICYLNGSFLEKIYDSKDCAFLQVITTVRVEPHSSKEILSLNYTSDSLEAGTYIIKAFSAETEAETKIEISTDSTPEFATPEFPDPTLLLILVLIGLFVVVFSRRKRSASFESVNPRYSHSGTRRFFHKT